jgi:uracil-DNA glycosylase family 4
MQELSSKWPLTGPSGEVFWRTLPKNLRENYGIDLDEDVLILNTLQCRVPRAGDDGAKNLARTQKGAAVCERGLREQVAEYPRRLIIAMGNFALRALTGNPNYKITQIRGQVIPSTFAKIGIMPVVHPAALLRGTGNYRQFRNDIGYAFHLAAGGPPRTPIEPKRWYVAGSPDNVAQMVEHLRTKPYIACDTETGGFSPRTSEILAVGLCSDPEEVFIVPGHLVEYLRPLFMLGHEGPRFIWHNGKFDMGFMQRPMPLGVGDVARVDEDTMLLSYTLDENGGIHDLEQVGSDWIGARDYKHMLKPYLTKKSTSYRVIPKPVLYHYLAIDCSNTLQIFYPMHEQVMRDERLATLYNRVLLEASKVLTRVERKGILVCKNRVRANAKRLSHDVDIANNSLQRLVRRAGYQADINPRSPKQLAILFYDILHWPLPRGGNRGTGKAVLDALPKHPIIDALRDYRKASKALSTYVTSLERSIDVDGRVHACYLIHGTRTGRLSSRKPNMQNIIRDVRLRGMYMAAPGHVFIKVDLNQAELRSLALLSGDAYLMEVYTSNNRSLHKETANDFFPGWSKYKDTAQGKEDLMRAKAVNFGVVYGRTALSIADEFKISVVEAQKWIDIWFARSPGAKKFIDRCRAAPLNGSTLVTCFGRKKRHWLVTAERLQSLQNEASNFPHQSIASDICLLGVAMAEPILRPYGIDPVNLVHDEAMFECPDIPELIAWAKHVIITCMELIPRLWGLTAIPFKAEADVGRRWSIYRNPKDPRFKYEYQTNNDEDWKVPSSHVLYALARDQEAKEEQARAAHSKVLAAMQTTEARMDGDWAGAPNESDSEELADGVKLADGADPDPASDWSEDDGHTAFGVAPTADTDSPWRDEQ